MSKFNEDSRVKIPAILHLIRLGYEYMPLKNASWDQETNIFNEIFKDSVSSINIGIKKEEAERLLEDVKLSLENEDLGQAFHQLLIDQSGIKLIDFENFNKNQFHVVTELTYKNGDEEFRPDITLLINGLPLVLIEVKKPHNREGVLAEHNRITKRFQNQKFKRFINITQMMLFSNNMKYNSESPLPIEGAFYASPSYQKPAFNFFREEKTFELTRLLRAEDEVVENEVLKDNNLNVIKHSPEFITNKSPSSPTNRICTWLLSRDRLSFMLQYAFAYVNETDRLQKHIMRYPQVFATIAIAEKLDKGV